MNRTLRSPVVRLVACVVIVGATAAAYFLYDDTNFFLYVASAVGLLGYVS